MSWLKRKLTGLFHRVFSQTKTIKTIYKGLVVMDEILTASCQALEEKDPDFKYLGALKVVNEFVKKIMKYFQKYLLTSMSEEQIAKMEERAIEHEKAVRALSTDNELACTLARLSAEIPN